MLDGELRRGIDGGEMFRPVLGIDPGQRGHPTAAKSGAWHQDGFPTSKLPGSPPSFSAWRLCSPSSCCPLGERSRQDEQITGDSMKAGVRQG